LTRGHEGNGGSLAIWQGFFWFQRVELGGETMNLYALENHVVRGRFREPRIHFALNCASASAHQISNQP